MEKSTRQQLSIQDWETLIDDFQFSVSGREKWLSQYPPPSLLELALVSVLRKDFPLKIQLIVFVEENYETLIKEMSAVESLAAILESLRAVVQAPVDSGSVTYHLKEQMMASSTSIFISMDAIRSSKDQLEGLVELLLAVVNRPNHGADRQTRAIASECLRELERAYPCLLSEIAPHLWSLCQSERTHASQSYLLLLTSVIHNLIQTKTLVPILTTSLPLIPFNIPHSLVSPAANAQNSSNSKDLNMKELRRVVSFLLERPQILTPCGMMEFMGMMVEVGSALELQASLLKVQFSGMLYSYDPILSHVVLTLYSRFSDAFEGDEIEIAQRLVLKAKEQQQHLVFRLLALHWLLGLPVKKESDKRGSILGMLSNFYPAVFDPLALKAVKLDLLAYCATCIDVSKSGTGSSHEDPRAAVVRVFEEGLVCVSAFKWLPPWSTETMVAFRTLNKFLIGDIPHSRSDASSTGFLLDSTSTGFLLDSTIFCILQNFLVSMALEFRRLVPVLVSFIDRLLGCHAHCWLGERLLQTMDEHLLLKLVIDHHLASYFPIFDRIAKTETIPPRGLLELLSAYVVSLVKDHNPDAGLKSWSQGSKILGICRTMLMHHNSSKVFVLLSRLLAFTCQFFPDLEVRDSARIYLRMLICIPGKKLRHLLNLGEQLPGISPSPHLSSFFQAQSPRPFRDLKKSREISSYIHLDRVIPLIVKQSWTLAVSTLGFENDKPSNFEGIKDSEYSIDIEQESETSSSIQLVSETERISLPQEPLRVMDTKVAEILEILRMHFSHIPDFRHMQGLKIQIPCTLRFEADSFNRIWGSEKSTRLDEVDNLPALYATVIAFSSSAPYGTIPRCQIPFLMGQPSKNSYPSSQTGQLEIAPVQNGSGHEEEEDGDDEEGFRAAVVIELEPREPMPGLVDVAFEANAENGQIVCGPLRSITVGIEDMFLKVDVPPNIQKDSASQYYLELFNALWEACGSSTNTGREIFPLKGRKGVAAISGTQSVKLLEVSSESLIGSIEHHLAPFVVSVVGQPLVDIVKDSGIIKDAVWKEDLEYYQKRKNLGLEYSEGSPLQLKYTSDGSDGDAHLDIRRRNMGSFLVLIFLPPQFHLMFQMEVSDISTLVRIRTDHWPCLAYIDDYLEALFLT